MKPPANERYLVQVAEKPETYYLGRFGKCSVALLKTSMGPSGPTGATLAAAAALQLWKPKAIIMVGIAFGADREKHKIGDVLVADTVQLYDPERIGETVVPRGANAPTGSLLVNRFENALGWQFVRPDKTVDRVHKGKLLSGSKLLDNPIEKQALMKRYPGSIGGEMEAAGIWAAAARERTEWAIVKAVCDWADGRKHKHYQEIAAASAASLCLEVLSAPSVLRGIP